MANLFQRIFNTGVTLEGRSSELVIPQRSSATIVTPMSALTLTAVYRSIQIIATPISDMDLDTERYVGGVETSIENPLIINKPSLNMTRREFLFQSVVSLATYGECFWLKTFSPSGQVNSVDVLPAEGVGVFIDPKTFVKTFSWAGVTYTPNDIEHVKLFTMAGKPRGMGPIQMCAQDIQSALDLRDWAANWFASSGVPTGVLTTNLTLSADQANEITERWHEKQSERKVAVLGSGANYAQIELSPKDALMTDVASQSVQAMARLFGIPARLLVTGVDGTSLTYANLSDEEKTFWRHTLSAYTDPIEDGLSNLLPRGTSVEFDFDKLFKADTSTRYANYATGIQAGFLTPEYVQAKEGIDVQSTNGN